MFETSVYCYKLKNGKQLCYDEKGWFKCPNETDENRYQRHSHIAKGELQRKFMDEKTEASAQSGMTIETRRTLVWKASKKNPPYCKECKVEMVWKGYPVWLEKVLDEGKVVGGMFRMGGKEKRYWYKRFKTKRKQREFIKKFLTKE